MNFTELLRSLADWLPTITIISIVALTLIKVYPSKSYTQYISIQKLKQMLMLLLLLALSINLFFNQSTSEILKIAIIILTALFISHRYIPEN